MHIEALHILCGIAYDIRWEVMTNSNICQDAIAEEFYSTRHHCLFKKCMR